MLLVRCSHVLVPWEAELSPTGTARRKELVQTGLGTSPEGNWALRTLPVAQPNTLDLDTDGGGAALFPASPGKGSSPQLINSGEYMLRLRGPGGAPQPAWQQSLHPCCWFTTTLAAEVQVKTAPSQRCTT